MLVDQESLQAVVLTVDTKVNLDAVPEATAHWRAQALSTKHISGPNGINRHAEPQVQAV